ncbi:Hypothetical predicted protein [Cloeon dipterum]|uniref:Splicing factor 3B subunit 5 n=1 Tax=Cloeon dipterum TaxID=197152 RepID=A0A8S1CBZ4_9INSE|nr:Hypothetical predicted protein [Cloeon dipterum]
MTDQGNQQPVIWSNQYTKSKLESVSDQQRPLYALHCAVWSVYLFMRLFECGIKTNRSISFTFINCELQWVSDTTKFEWLVNQHRDSYSSYIGHHDLLNFFAITENETKARMKFQLMEKMLQPCGPPPEKPED